MTKEVTVRAQWEMNLLIAIYEKKFECFDILFTQRNGILVDLSQFPKFN